MTTNSEVEELLKEMVIRRIRTKHFGQLLQLVSEAYKMEAEITGSIQRFSRIAKLYPLVEMFLPLFDIFHRDFDTILVAVSRDRLIGEIHLVPHGKKIWSLDSSAVDPMFRRHGVYRALLEEALRYISKKRGERVISSVWADNVPVLKMRRGPALKFEVYEKDILLALELSEIPTVKFDEGVSIRKIKRADVEQIYQICKTLSPKELLIYKIAPGDFLDSFLGRIISKMAWASSRKWVMGVKGKIIGYTHVTYTPPQEAGKIESFYVLPSNKSSELISLFLSKLLEFLATKNIRKVTVVLNEEWKETVKIFKSFGFKPIASVYKRMKELV